MENLGEKGKEPGQGEKEKQAYRSNYLPTINKIPLGLGHASRYSIFGKLPQRSLKMPCTSLSSHPSRALSKWNRAMEGREEEEAGGGPVRHHGHAQWLMTVPPLKKSTPHFTGRCRTRVSLCCLCSLVQEPLTPRRG